MEEYTVISIFFLLDDLVQAQKLHHYGEKIATSEVALTGIVTATWFGGNLTTVCLFLKQNYIPNMISISRLVRRLHKLPESFWRTLLGLLAGKTSQYVVDSFPVASYHPVRSFVAKLFRGEQFRGYNSYKKE